MESEFKHPPCVHYAYVPETLCPLPRQCHTVWAHSPKNLENLLAGEEYADRQTLPICLLTMQGTKGNSKTASQKKQTTVRLLRQEGECLVKVLDLQAQQPPSPHKSGNNHHSSKWFSNRTHKHQSMHRCACPQTSTKARTHAHAHAHTQIVRLHFKM